MNVFFIIHLQFIFTTNVYKHNDSHYKFKNINWEEWPCQTRLQAHEVWMADSYQFFSLGLENEVEARSVIGKTAQPNTYNSRTDKLHLISSVKKINVGT